jgi:hypothetical protein
MALHVWIFTPDFWSVSIGPSGARIQTTLDLYTQDDIDEILAAQGEYLTALGVCTQMVQ